MRKWFGFFTFSVHRLSILKITNRLKQLLILMLYILLHNLISDIGMIGSTLAIQPLILKRTELPVGWAWVLKYLEMRLSKLESHYGQQCTPKSSLCCPQWTHYPKIELLWFHLWAIMYTYRVALTKTKRTRWNIDITLRQGLQIKGFFC